MASRILGKGDIVSLVEKAQVEFDTDEAQKLEEKLKRSRFDFNDFLAQIKQIKKMGSVSSLAAMIPGVGNALKGKEIDEKVFTRVEAVILSMTEEERKTELTEWLPKKKNSKRKRKHNTGS